MQTTLNQIKAKSPCESGWKKLLKHLGKTKADDAPLPLLTILESNGLMDAVWCLRAVKDEDSKIRKMACEFALSVKHLWNMPLIVREYLTTQNETIRERARDAAYAAYAAAYAAYAAAYDADAAAAADAAYAAAAYDAADAAEKIKQVEIFKRICMEV